MKTYRLDPKCPHCGRSGAADAAYCIHCRNPRRVGRYHIRGLLGAGGMGSVFLADDPEIDRRVAIKFLKRETADQESSVAARFRREALAVAKLDHPGVVRIFDAAEDSGRLYLVMEFVEGESLAQRLRRGPIPPREAARIARSLAVTLAHAHRRGVLHRDVKPANVVIEPSGRVRLLDFGLAKVLGHPGGATTTGVILGTPAYMAPELVTEPGSSIAPSVDIYALGAVLYQMLTGRLPYTAVNAMALLRKLEIEDPMPLRQVNPAVPEELARIVERAMARDPRLRFASGEEMARELERPVMRRSIPRRRWLAVAGGSVALLALAVTAFAGGRDRVRGVVAGKGVPAGLAAHPADPAAGREFSMGRFHAAAAAWEAAGESEAAVLARFFAEDMPLRVTNDPLLTLGAPEWGLGAERSLANAARHLRAGNLEVARGLLAGLREDSADAWALRAVEAAAGRRVDEAEADVAAGLSLSAFHPPLLWLAAVTARLRGEEAEAESRTRAWRWRADPDAVEARLAEAAYLSLAGDWRAAAESIERLDGFERDPVCRLVHAVAFLRRHESGQEPPPRSRIVRELGPAWPEGHRGALAVRALLMNALGDEAEARRLSREFADALAPGEEMAEPRLRLMVDGARWDDAGLDAALSLTRAAFAAPPEAESLLTGFLDWAEAAGWAPEELVVSARLARARTRIALGRREEALDDATRVIEAATWGPPALAPFGEEARRICGEFGR